MGRAIVRDAAVHDVRDWQRVVGEAFVPLDVTATSHGSFHARMHAVSVGGALVSDLSTGSGHLVRHTRAGAGTAPPGQAYKVSLQLRGRSTVRQHGREAELGSGQLAVYDTADDYELCGATGRDGEFRTLVLMVPRSLLGLAADRVRELLAVTIPGDTGSARLLTPLLREVADDRSHLEHEGSGATVRAATALLSVTLLDVLGAGAVPGGRLGVVQAWIEDHLGEPLDPAAIAAANHVSTRTLHALFHAEGQTVGGWVRRRRLERCRADLLDPRSAGTTVAAVGRRWGFPDPAHFSRAFRGEFGTSPRDLRP
ncbi:AraC-like ligand-binding domain-containing protein [Kineococcus sp. SYSU DK001]|uniref:AraC-like ligand-binding domain-containing protein n=1 Tax=Kineococcus sp. SYSU DK001 TaxID=3383122 RepID=UPI003D7C4CE0